MTFKLKKKKKKHCRKKVTSTNCLMKNIQELRNAFMVCPWRAETTKEWRLTSLIIQEISKMLRI